MSKGPKHTDKVVADLKAHRLPINHIHCQRFEKSEDGEENVLHICSRSDGEHCSVYAFPSAKWTVGDCPMADEFLRSQTEEQVAQQKVRVGQQKQKKHR